MKVDSHTETTAKLKHDRAVMLLCITTALNMGRAAAVTNGDAKESFDKAEELLREAERRGLDLTREL